MFSKLYCFILEQKQKFVKKSIFNLGSPLKVLKSISNPFASSQKREELFLTGGVESSVPEHFSPIPLDASSAANSIPANCCSISPFVFIGSLVCLLIVLHSPTTKYIIYYLDIYLFPFFQIFPY